MKTIAIIGCGKRGTDKEGWAIGRAHAGGYLETGHDIRLLGVDLSPDNLKAFGEKFSLPDDQLFSSTEALYAACTPDVVSVCTWPGLHHPMVLEAIKKGVKGIACEKPFTLDVGQQREIEKKVASAGVVLVVAHQRRREAGFKALKEVARSGKLGQELTVIAELGDGWDILSWTTHWFDMANFFFEGPPDWVMAGMDIRGARRYQQAVEDASIVYADYGDRGKATFLTGPRRGGSFVVRGSEGIARIAKGAIECATFAGAEEIPFQPGMSGVGAMLKELLDALDGGPEPLCSIRHSAAATEMAYAAHESARTGKKVFLPLEVQFAPLEVAQHRARSALFGKKVLLYADSHFGSRGREGVAEAFGEMTGNQVKVIDAQTAGLHAADVDGIDAILIYHTQKAASDETKGVLESWVADGRPLLITHAGLGAWPEWTEYQSWCGNIWEWGVSVHPHEPTVLTVPEGDPLSFGWSEAWLPRDEVFVKLKATAPVEVGLTARISIGDFAAAWRLKEQPNVGVWMPGHLGSSWRVPAMREGAGRVLLSLMRS